MLDLSPEYIPIVIDGLTFWHKHKEIITVPSKEQVMAEADKKWVCPNCKKYWKVIFDKGTLREQRCSHCNADMEGKVYPKKRETPKEVKIVLITENAELDILVSKVLTDNPKVVADYKAGKKQSVGFLVGCVLKQMKANPAEVKARLEKALNEAN